MVSKLIKNMLFLGSKILFVAACFFALANPAHAVLPTCKPGERSVLIIDGHTVKQCDPPLTKEGVEVLMGAIQATEPKRQSEEYKRADRFCRIYMQGTGPANKQSDLENALRYCGELAALGSPAGIDVMCPLLMTVGRLDDALAYCNKSGELGNLDSFFYAAAVHSKKGESDKLARALLAGFDYNVIRMRNFSPIRREILEPRSRLSATGTITFLTMVMSQTNGASLESIGLRPMQIPPQIALADRYKNPYMTNNARQWYAANFDSDWTDISVRAIPKDLNGNYKVSIFVVDEGSGSTGMPVLCDFNAEKNLKRIICDNIVSKYVFSSAIDIDGNYAPGYLNVDVLVKDGILTI